MKYTLWSLLKERKIEIPIFQRDYAQGREDKATLRRDILQQLHTSLILDSSKDGHMDFVYSFGDTNAPSQPLDGQQRLTTLWLLYWYLAINVLKEDELETALQRLKRFSYRTRRSSSNFIDALCDIKCVSGLRNNQNISSAIRNYTWFDKAWDKDPTVKGMLFTLSGQSNENNSGPNSIQSIFDTNRNEFPVMWQLLISEECPIHFDFITIEDVEVKSPDLLYVKMNARGKPLSSFEKFKAQWINNMREKNADEAFEISRLIDNQWNDVFWSVDLKICGIDQRKMAFYSRCFFCYLLDRLCTSFKELNLTEKAKIISESVLYHNERGSDYCFPFNSIEDFSIEIPIKNDNTVENNKIISLLSTEAVKSLNIIFKSINALDRNVITACLPSFMSDFDFLSELQKDSDNKYKEDKDGNYWVKQLTMKQQVVFYALFLYLRLSKNPNVLALKRWIRVCSNIAENTNRDSSIQQFVNIISKIRELAVFNNGKYMGCEDIYNTLLKISIPNRIPNNELEAMIWEEKEKAKEILEDLLVSEDEIIEAENYAFFNGAIRFLFVNESKNVDWSQFHRKFAICKELFNSDGLNEHTANNFHATRILISYCTHWMTQIQQKTYHLFSKNHSDWKKILLSPDYHKPVHNLLFNYKINSTLSLEDEDIWRTQSHAFLIGTSYLDYIDYNKREGYFISWREDGMCLFLPYNPDKSYYITSKRIRMIDSLKKEFSELVKIDWPKDKLYSRTHKFDFYYKDFKFRLQHWEWIDMYGEDEMRLIDNPALDGKYTIEFPSNELEIKQIIYKLNGCIDSYKKWLKTQMSLNNNN